MNQAIFVESFVEYKFSTDISDSTFLISLQNIVDIQLLVPRRSRVEGIFIVDKNLLTLPQLPC